MNCTTGFATGTDAAPELAAEAVHRAVARLGGAHAHGVLLFLTPHFARHAQAAVTAASRAGQCLQVTGCTTPGVFTDEGWSLEQPAAAALALAGAIRLAPPGADLPRLSLALPEALDNDWLAAAGFRFGTLATGDARHPVGAVWSHGKWLVEGRGEAELSGAELGLAVSRGMQPLSEVAEVEDVDGYELQRVGGQTPLAALAECLPPEARSADDLPVALLFAAVVDAEADTRQAIASGRYALVPIVAANGADGSFTMGAPLAPGMRIFWALRHPEAAAEDFEQRIELIGASRADAPEFALLFACIGRGPYFFGGEDRDLAALRRRFPGLPVLGCYGGGEIAPLVGGAGTRNVVLSYSSVAALAYRDVQSQP